MPSYVERFLDKYWKTSGQTVFHDIPVVILVKVIYPFLLQNEYFLVLNFNRENPGFPTPVKGELHEPGNSSCCWGCWMQGILPIPASKSKMGDFDASLSSMGVCHGEGVGAGQVALFWEQITIQGGAGQIKEERFRGGEENAESKDQDQDARICSIFLLCSSMGVFYSFSVLYHHCLGPESKGRFRYTH